MDEQEADIEDELGELQNTVSKQRDLASQLEAVLSRDVGRLEGLQSQLDTIEKERGELLTHYQDDWEEVLSQSPEEIATVQKKLLEAKDQLYGVQQEASTEVDEARDALAIAQTSLEKTKKSVDELDKKLAASNTDSAHLKGELGLQIEAAEKEDEEAAQTLLTERTAELEALPPPDEDVDEQGVEDAVRITQEAGAEVRRLQLEMREAEGALGQTGGQYIEEQAEQAREAVEAAAAKEREVDLDYGAWTLLRDALQEAESEDGAHLGNALVGPVSERMAALTGGRYGAVEIEPQLQTSGIELGGITREYRSLSLGTQEQLATLLRLSIAEALGSFIVMDDQLTQSDSGRIGKIRGMLQEAAKQVQVLVFTCRPQDYGDGEADPNAINLADCVHRRVISRSDASASVIKESGVVAESADVVQSPDLVELEAEIEKRETEEIRQNSTDKTADLAAALRDSLGKPRE